MIRVEGAVRLIKNELCVVPFAPAEVEQNDEPALRLSGHDLPKPGQRVVVNGSIDKDVLRVCSWEPNASQESAWNVSRAHEGVDLQVADSVLESIPSHWELIGFGVSTMRNGNHVAVVQVVSETAEVRTWFQAQPTGSVLLFPFIR